MCSIAFEIWWRFEYGWLKAQNELKLVESIFTTHLNTCGSNMFLAFKIMNFEYVYLRKAIHFYGIENKDA